MSGTRGVLVPASHGRIDPDGPLRPFLDVASRAEPIQDRLPRAVVGTERAHLQGWHDVAQRGVDADRTVRQLRTLGVRVEPFTLADALATSRLWPATRTARLPLGDRACLALAQRLAIPALIADTAWTGLDLGVRVVPIR